MNRALLIEDNDLDVKLFTELAEGWEFEIAGTIKDGKQKAIQSKIDVVILDMHLPDGCGLDIAELLHEQRPELRVVVMSGTVCSKLASQILQDWNMRFVEKPITRASVMAILNEYS